MRKAPRFQIIASLCLLGSGGWHVIGREAAQESPVFAEKIQPLVEKYCLDCHDSDTAKGHINLEQFDSEVAFWRDPKLWERALVQLREHTMPPVKKPQPAEEERTRLVEWVASMLEHPDISRLPKDPGRTLIRRLSRAEYNNTVRDLLGVDTHPAELFPPDDGGGGGFDNNAATLYMQPLFMEKLLDVTESVLAAAAPERLFPVKPRKGMNARATAKANLTELARRAFRRPSSAVDVDRFLSAYDAALRRGEADQLALKSAAKAILMSPRFLFRIEQEPAKAAEPYRIDDFDLASRLSYFIWASMPDEKLFRVAGENKLHEPEVLEQQMRRMLADPKARDFADSFASQWLHTKELYVSVEPYPQRFPEYTAKLRDAFYAESIDFFYALIRDNLPLTDCLNCNYTFANETLAKFYGISDVTGEEMRRVNLHDPNRGGVLGMGGVLCLGGNPRRTSPVNRGKWVLEEILGSTAPPPPPSVDKGAVGNDKVKDGLTFRQRMEQHRQDSQCAGCHARMDPLGFGLENFDAIGAWRTEISGVPIDASGQLVTGETFNGPLELKQLLMKRKDEFLQNLTERMLAYALGRGIEPSDWYPVRQIVKAVAVDGYRAQTLVLEIARSYPFQYRRPYAAPQVAVASP